MDRPKKSSFVTGDLVAGSFQFVQTHRAGFTDALLEVHHTELDERFFLSVVPRPEGAHRGGLDDLRQLARSLARIPGDSVPRVVGAGRLDEERAYLLVPYFTGTSLVRLVDHGAGWSADLVAALMKETCEALAAAHALGIVHGRLTTSSVFWTRRHDGTPTIKVLDFGLAGTPGAPEMSPVADIQAAGVMLYQLLASKPPSPARTLDVLVDGVKHKSYSILDDGWGPVPTWLHQIVIRCLIDAPHARFQSMAQLARALGEPASVAELRLPRLDLSPWVNFDAKRRKIVAPAPPVPVPMQHQQALDCLVVVHTLSSALLGKYYRLGDAGVRIGRSADNDVVLEGTAVSRKHALVRRSHDEWQISDLGSANGTFVNGARIERETVLADGDLVEIGADLLRLLTGPDVESKYHDQLQRFIDTDILTGLPHWRSLVPELTRRLAEEDSLEYPVSMLLIHVDHLDRLRREHGDHACNAALRGVAAELRTLLEPGDHVVRLDLDTFCAARTGAIPAAALARAEAVRAAVERRQIRTHASDFQITVTVALVLRRAGEAIEALLERARSTLHTGMFLGKNRVVSEEIVGLLRDRRLLPVARLVEEALTFRGTLCAFEIDGEAALAQELGPGAYDESHDALRRAVVRAARPTDGVSDRKERQVLVALREATPGAAEDLAERVRAEWVRARGPDAREIVTPAFRWASVAGDELPTSPERAVDELLTRLLPGAPASASPGDDLPFPLPALARMAAARRTAKGHVRALLDSLRTALRLLVAIEIAAIRDLGDRPQQEAAARLLAERIDDSDGWERCALDLAPLVPAGCAPISGLAAVFSKAEVREQLASILDQAVGLRRSLGEASGPHEPAWTREEGALGEVLSTLLVSLRPLASTRLATVAHVGELWDDEPVEYRLYVHRGPTERFPVVTTRSPFRLRKGGCYLFLPDADRAPLLLAPVVAAGECAVCGRMELRMADRLAPGAPGTTLAAHGVPSGHETSIHVPAHPGIEAFHALVAAYKGSAL